MKYMQNGGFQTHPLMRLTLIWTTVFLAGLWVSNFVLYFSRMGLEPQSVVDYYLGSASQFTPPRSFGSMLEVTHMHLPMMALVVLLLTHLLIFAPMSNEAKVSFISLTFGSALVEEGSGWLVRFVHPGFAWLKIISFLTFQAFMAYLLAALAVFLIRQSPTKDPSHASGKLSKKA
jgi:hypothetical protein